MKPWPVDYVLSDPDIDARAIRRYTVATNCFRTWHRLGWFGQIMLASALLAAFELLVLPRLVRHIFSTAVGS